MAKSTKVSNKLEDKQVPQDVENVLQFPEDVNKRTIKVQFDITYGGTPGVEMDGESETIPDMNLTVRQLLENHSRGLDSNVKVRQPLYFDMEVPTIRDITDVEKYKKALELKLSAVNEFVEKEIAEAQEAEKVPETAEKAPSTTNEGLVE